MDLESDSGPRTKDSGSDFARPDLLAFIAQALIDLMIRTLSSFRPDALQAEYGWQMQIIGDKCYVVAVKPE